MDAVIVIGIALVIAIKSMFFLKPEMSDAEVVAEDVTRTTKLNEDFYEDPNAFSYIINLLGFPRGR